MKKAVGIAMVVLMSTLTCKKKEDNVVSTWKVDNNNRTAQSVIVQGNQLIATDRANSIVVTFGGSFPATAGSLPIVAANPQAGEVSVTVTEGQLVLYTTTGKDKKSASVAKEGSKIRISIPEVHAVRVAGTDSVTVWGDLREP
ncbi:MAG TPA: hypothetical protein VL098_06350 [Flavipsychrobacter sp.]|nr:hypothetical protein [Flavipsychrobacter sp.]